VSVMERVVYVTGLCADAHGALERLDEFSGDSWCIC